MTRHESLPVELSGEEVRLKGRELAGKVREYQDFRPVEGWPEYWAGADGHVYSSKRWRGSGWRRLAEGRDRDGYATVQVTVAQRTTMLRVHQVVCAAFHGPKPTPEHQVCHGDGCPTNNRPTNLRWGTPFDNAADRAAHGRTVRGERCGGGGVLSEEQVRQIKALLRRQEPARRLARTFGVSSGMIDHIKSGRQWRHIP